MVERQLENHIVWKKCINVVWDAMKGVYAFFMGSDAYGGGDLMTPAREGFFQKIKNFVSKDNLWKNLKKAMNDVFGKGGLIDVTGTKLLEAVGINFKGKTLYQAIADMVSNMLEMILSTVEDVMAKRFPIMAMMFGWKTKEAKLQTELEKIGDEIKLIDAENKRRGQLNIGPDLWQNRRTHLMERMKEITDKQNLIM